MTPRLTTAARVDRVQSLHRRARKLRQYGIKSRRSLDADLTRPSPAERLRQRRKARAAVMRFHRAKDLADRMLTEKDRRENRMTYLNNIYVQNQMKSFETTVLDWRGPPGELPQSSGTTTKENDHA